MTLRALFIFVAIHPLATLSFAASDAKGLLPEVRMTDSESENEKRALTSEMMITRSETKAIDSLQNLIKKNKGQPEEVDLLYRLAELFMRRSKSGRFFDLNKGAKLLKLSPFPIPAEGGKDYVRKASTVYSRIEKDFPKFDQMDSVLFNNAFANQQLNQIKASQDLFKKLLSRFPNSPLIPDATLAYGELLYDQHQFETALEQFLRVEKYPQSRVYSYGMYKAAWSYYNMKDSEHGVQKLIAVVKINPPLEDGQVPTNRHNLRKEALRDLTIFIGDMHAPSKLYSFFADLTEGEELGVAITDLAKLYEAHGRQKEMNIFLQEYIEKQPKGSAVVRAHLALVDANENLKLRDKVISNLDEASKRCQKSSAWRNAQKPDVVIESCDENYRRTSLEIAAKWWEIWLKNKNNAEFSALTERAFKIILDNEDPKKPDLKTRFAYAELLFQQNKFEAASAEYKIVGTGTTDPTLSHDADYAALFSIEKSIEGDKKQDHAKDADRKDLALNYLKKHPAGKYARSVQFKMGHIFYQESNYEEAEKRLTPLADSKTQDEFKKKSEDLLLDILNLKKDYAGIQKFSKRMLSSTTDNNRKESLNKIVEEANFAEIQEFAKTGDKNVSAAKLSQFATEHSHSKLAGEALWQSLSLYYAQGKTYEAAEMSVRYADKYPQDKRSLDALKEAAKAYAECGELTKSAETLKRIAGLDTPNKLTHLELAADMYILERNRDQARQIYTQIAAATEKKNLDKVYGKLLATYRETDRNLEYEKLENKILQQGIEPFTTQIMTRRAKALYEAGKYPAAFDLAMKANSRDSASEFRAESRLIQARILEKELLQQSVKAREDKFAMVLSMKTEKLDKAQTAYVTALKMAKDPFVQLEALRGIDRCYGNYVESLRAIPLPEGLNAQDQDALRKEIAKIISPIQDKRKENESKLKQLATTQGQGLSTERNLRGLAANATVSPLVVYPAPSKLKPIYPNPKITQTSELEKQGQALARTKEQRPLGLYYLSLAAEAKASFEKALWLAEQSLKLDGEKTYAIYQKARLLYKLEGMSSAKGFFDKLLDMPNPSTEMQTFAAIKSFSEGDFNTAIEKFSRLKREEIYNYQVGALYSESFAQKGEVDKALKTVKDLLQGNQENVDLLLEQAHLLEEFKASPEEALPVYEKLQKVSKEEDLRSWLERKINYIKNPNKVVQNVISGD